MRDSRESTVLLQEKIIHLQETQALKDTRFNQMIEKEANLKGQINELKNKN